MKTTQNFLITIQGATSEKDVLERFSSQLERLSFSIQNMHFLNFQSSLFLLMHLELAESSDKKSLTKVLDKVAKHYKLELLICQLPESSITSPENRYILTLLSRQLPPKLLTKLFRYLRKNQLCVTEVRPLD